jgi:hypothetical protein
MYNKIAGLLALTMVSGCATVANGTHQSIGISSNPSNAFVWVDQNYVGTTPIVVGMSRKDNHVVTIELEGFEPYEAVFTRKLSGWVFGNIIIGGFIGLAVDAISGGIYKLTPDQVQAEMYAHDMAYSKRYADSYIAVVLQPNPAWEKVGNLVAVNP